MNTSVVALGLLVGLGVGGILLAAGLGWGIWRRWLALRHEQRLRAEQLRQEQLKTELLEERLRNETLAKAWERPREPGDP
jgi:hypothetical protein